MTSDLVTIIRFYPIMTWPLTRFYLRHGDDELFQGFGGGFAEPQPLRNVGTVFVHRARFFFHEEEAFHFPSLRGKRWMSIICVFFLSPMAFYWAGVSIMLLSSCFCHRQIWPLFKSYGLEGILERCSTFWLMAMYEEEESVTQPIICQPTHCPSLNPSSVIDWDLRPFRGRKEMPLAVGEDEDEVVVHVGEKLHDRTLIVLLKHHFPPFVCDQRKKGFYHHCTMGQNHHEPRRKYWLLARPFAHSLAPHTHSLAPHCSFVRSLLTHSWACGKVND